MHIHVVPNRGSPPTILLRESYREGAKVRKRTLANLSSLSLAQVEAMRALLRGEELRPIAQCFEITASRSHGHVQAITAAMQRLGLASLIASKPGRERDLVLAMVAARIVAPQTEARYHPLVAHHDAGRRLRRGRCENGVLKVV